MSWVWTFLIVFVVILVWLASIGGGLPLFIAAILVTFLTVRWRRRRKAERKFVRQMMEEREDEKAIGTNVYDSGIRYPGSRKR